MGDDALERRLLRTLLHTMAQISQDPGGPEAAFGVIFGSDKMESGSHKRAKSHKTARRANQGGQPQRLRELLRRADVSLGLLGAGMRGKNCLSDRMTMEWDTDPCQAPERVVDGEM